jgi:hypothetical protein
MIETNNEYITRYEKLQQKLDDMRAKLKIAEAALKEIESAIPIETSDKLGFPLTQIAVITLEALAALASIKEV